MQLSALAQQLKPSATLAAGARAKELMRFGIPVQNLTQGEPNFDTPKHIRDAAIEAIELGKTHYTEATGIPELRQAVCDAYLRDYQVNLNSSNVAISNGAKHSIHNVLTCLCGPGDEVIIPTPYWVSYAPLVKLTGASPVFVETYESEDFLLCGRQFAEAITDRTKMLLLNNPGNPTGSVYSASALRAILQEAIDHDVFILADEIYGKLTYGQHNFYSMSTLSTDLPSQLIIVDGVSKAYAMTGWRIGWTIATEEIIATISKVQGQQTSNPSSISQHAALAALNGPQDCIEIMRKEFEKRRDYVVSRLKEVPDISFIEPGGAFYLFINVREYFDRFMGGGVRVNNATDFCSAVLDNAHIALVAGDAFGAPDYVRLSFATEMATLEAGCDLLVEYLLAAQP